MPRRLINEALVVGVTLLEEQLATNHFVTCENVNIVGESPDRLCELSKRAGKLSNLPQKRRI
jgi:hypothetical protein